MSKQKVLTLLVLLMTAVTGAWAQEQSETIATTANIVEGTHFTISNNGFYADGDGMGAPSGITVTSKNGETITKVVISCTYLPGDVKDGNTSVSSGTKEITNGGRTITVTGVNASTFTFTCSDSGPQFCQFVVYYTAPAGYTVSMPQDTPDAGNWTAKAGSATTFSALPLEGVAQGTQVSLKYAGTNLVKSVAVRPADALDGKFSVSATKQVYFSQGNLQYVGTEWSFHTNQYDVIGTTQTDGNRDLFGWGTGDDPNKVSTNDNDYNTWKDWGDNMGQGWRTMTQDEWKYLFANHSYGFATVNGVTGTIVLPDDCTLTINTSLNSYDNNTIDAATWQSTYAPEGVLFLPAQGFRNGNTVNQNQLISYYWSSTSAASNSKSGICFGRNNNTTYTSYQNWGGKIGLAVRLVKDVEEPTAAGDNVWTFTMPAVDVEVSVVYRDNTPHAITLAAGTFDAENWSISPAEAPEGTLVTVSYNGSKLVRALKPTGALVGRFSVSDAQQVYFSQGSLQYVGTAWSFHTNQWDMIGTSQADGNRDLFGWGTGDAPNKVSTNVADYNTWTDWGDNMGPGWRTLTIDEWMYLFANHSFGFATVNGVTGTIVLPDGCSLTINTSRNSYDNNTIDAATWQSTYAPEGVLFLPAQGFRDGTTINQLQQSAYCWSSTIAANNKRSGIIFAISGNKVYTTYQDYNGHLGLAVRLVNDVVDVTSAGANAWTFTMPACDVELEPEYVRATLTAEPAAADGVGAGTAAALLTPGTSTEGTIYYALGQSDTQAPTDGWSTDVPTAQSLTQGTYYVWYKVVGDAQHIDSEPQCIEVTVAEAPIVATYTVALKEGTEDAANWTIAPAEATTTGVEAGTTVTATYAGALKVKSVRAKKAAAAPAGLTLDLATVTEATTVEDGYTLTGTLGGNYKISIAEGATVTLDGVTIDGVNNNSYQWAGITCLGDATIILKDDTENTVKGFYEDYPGIHVPVDKTLTIEGSGSLTASSNGYGCGIGGGYQIACGNIVIAGGTITANGGTQAAGIGSGRQGECGTISITGGTVNATGGYNAAGIGGGNMGSCGTVTITNGVTSVTATKGNNANYSIGAGNGGSCGTVTIGCTLDGDGNPVGGTTGQISTSPYTYQPSN